MSIKNLNYFLSITAVCKKCRKKLSKVIDPWIIIEELLKLEDDELDDKFNELVENLLEDGHMCE